MRVERRVDLTWAKSSSDRALRGKCIAPGRPRQNGLAQSCNGKLRDERLNQEVSATLAEARAVIER